MKNKKPVKIPWVPIGLGVVALVAIPFIWKATKTALTAESLKVEFDGIGRVYFAHNSMIIEIQVRVTNPTKGTIKIDNAFLFFKLGGIDLARAVVNQNNNLPSIAPTGITRLTIPFEIPAFNLGLFVPKALIGGLFKQPYLKLEAAGNLTANGINVPINVSKDIANPIDSIKGLVAKKQTTAGVGKIDYLQLLTDATNAGRKALPYTPHLDNYSPTYNIRKAEQMANLLMNRYLTKTDTTIKSNAGLKDTLPALKQLVKEESVKVAPLAKILKGKTLEQSAYNVWHFIKTHARFKMDKDGTEELRRFARFWHDRKSGVDCDCYTITSSALLTAMGYKPKIRLAAFKNRPNFSHIYTMVGKYAVDGNMNLFNLQPPGITKTSTQAITQ